MKKVKFLIVGSGPTGLGAAYRLKDKGESDYLIVDRSDFIGGLAASFKDQKGFTWDVGGHVQFSHYKYFDEAMQLAISKDKWLHHQRESWVWMRDSFVPYPFQNNIRFLPKDAMWDCLKGLIHVATSKEERPKPANFGEWIMASFGSGIAEHFMLPYNYKVWAFPPSDMNYTWIGDRVATVDLARIMENIVFDKMDANWGPNNTFQFPLEGGTGGIWNSIGRHVGLDKIRLNTEVVSINSKAHRAKLADGSEIQYDTILSTMPLDILTSMVDETQQSLRALAKELKHSSSNIIGIGVRGKPKPDLATKCWMYFPEQDCPFYRVTVFSNYSPKNVPGSEFYSLMCEVSESPAKHLKREAVVEDTVQGLYNTKLIPRDAEIVTKWSYHAPYGYPTPSVHRDAILAEVIPQLDKLEAYSRGRFGGWKYEVSNQDHSFMQGVEWVDFIREGTKEVTYRVDDTRDPNMGALKR